MVSVNNGVLKPCEGGIEMSSFYYLKTRAHERIREFHREAAAAGAAERMVSRGQLHAVYASLLAGVRTALAVVDLVPAAGSPSTRSAHSGSGTPC